MVTEAVMNSRCQRTMKTKLEPMKKVAKILELKQQLVFNWFDTDPRLSSGTVEAMNNKAKLTMRKVYRFRTENHLKYALYHNG